MMSDRFVGGPAALFFLSQTWKQSCFYSTLVGRGSTIYNWHNVFQPMATFLISLSLRLVKEVRW